MINGRDAPIEKHGGRESERDAAYQRGQAGDSPCADRAAMPPLDGLVASACLIETAPPAEPPLHDQKEQGHDDQQDAQDAGGGLIVPARHLLVYRIGQRLITQERDRAKIGDDIQDHQGEPCHDRRADQRERHPPDGLPRWDPAHAGHFLVGDIQGEQCAAGQ